MPEVHKVSTFRTGRAKERPVILLPPREVPEYEQERTRKLIARRLEEMGFPVPLNQDKKDSTLGKRIFVYGEDGKPMSDKDAGEDEIHKVLFELSELVNLLLEAVVRGMDPQKRLDEVSGFYPSGDSFLNNWIAKLQSRQEFSVEDVKALRVRVLTLLAKEVLTPLSTNCSDPVSSELIGLLDSPDTTKLSVNLPRFLQLHASLCWQVAKFLRESKKSSSDPDESGQEQKSAWQAAGMYYPEDGSVTAFALSLRKHLHNYRMRAGLVGVAAAELVLQTPAYLNLFKEKIDPSVTWLLAGMSFTIVFVLLPIWVLKQDVQDLAHYSKFAKKRKIVIVHELLHQLSHTATSLDGVAYHRVGLTVFKSPQAYRYQR